MRRYTIEKNDAGQRVDKFLSKAVKTLPPSLMYKYIRLKRIKVNSKRCEISQKLAVGDVVELYINDEFFDTPAPEELFKKAPTDIEIVYEDENIILVDKPVGLLVHEDDSESCDTLINRILHYLYDKGEYDPEKESSFTPALCNRIDMNTSGIVIAAKNAESLRIMNQKIKDRELKKLYICAVHGTPKQKTATLKNYLIKDEKLNKVTVYNTPRPNAKTIITGYKVLHSTGKYSLVEVDLLTGRTHQIRAHMAYICHPLVGDTKYGTNAMNKDVPLKFQALCSYRLEFDFSTDGGILNYLDKKTFTVKKIPFVKELFGKDMIL